MTIAKMEGGAPRIERQSDGSVGLYAVDGTASDPADRYHGFLFDRVTAIATGLSLIGTLQEGSPEDAPIFAVEAVQGAIVRTAGEPAYARLQLTVQQAELAVHLDREALTALIADLSALLRDLG